MILALLAMQQEFRRAPTSEFEVHELSGFTVMVSPAAKADQDALKPVLALMKEKLEEVGKLVPKDAYPKLQKVRFWIEHDDPKTPGMVFHPSAEWLKENNYNVDMAHGVEVGNLKNYLDWRPIQPYMDLHELSHAWEFMYMDDESKKLLKKTFDDAVSSGKYESVEYVRGGKKKAYALSNQHEYFAETCEAYFGKNDFYPFVKSELKSFDPEGYALVERAWKIK
ncbi:metallopeptidase [soil metagenome]